MKRRSLLVQLLCAAILAASLPGCGQSAPAPKEEYYIFATPLSTHAIWQQAREGFEDACRDLGVHGDWLGPAIIDTEEMERVIETGILQHCDGIITQGVVSEELIQEASLQGVPIVLVDSDMPDSGRLAYMGKDFHRQAQLFLEGVEKRLGKNEPLKIAIQAASLEFQIGKDQVLEIEKVFASHPGGFEIVDCSQSLSEPLRAKKEWERVIASHPEINVCINFAAESAAHCMQELRNVGRLNNDILVFGVDDVPETLSLIEEGSLAGSVVTSFYQYGYSGLKLLYDYQRTREKPENPQVSLILLEKDNLHTYREINDETKTDHH